MNNLFSISVEDIQNLANKHINRELSPYELSRVQKGLNAGLYNWEYVATVAIDEITKNNPSIKNEH